MDSVITCELALPSSTFGLFVLFALLCISHKLLCLFPQRAAARRVCERASVPQLSAQEHLGQEGLLRFVPAAQNQHMLLCAFVRACACVCACVLLCLCLCLCLCLSVHMFVCLTIGSQPETLTFLFPSTNTTHDRNPGRRLDAAGCE